MALLQIAEPGQSTAPHQHRLAAGIDLGTTNSLVATVRSGEAKVLRDEQDRAILPSVVYYGANEVLTGHEALAKHADKNIDTEKHHCFGEAFYWPHHCRRAEKLLKSTVSYERNR